MYKKYVPYLLVFIGTVTMTLGITSILLPRTTGAIVQLKNKSGQPLTDVIITHERGRIEVGELQNGQEMAVSVFTRGENSYRVQATLPNGKVITNQNYFEPSYCVVESMEAHRIQSDTYFVGCRF
ncbi:hypothetical protein [Calothrix sp. 336/3]|uniref:hypothetical protein n=1 Tax=Calothrix sp. 336/3 TaxID=1337936 RepID=UPI0004E38B95|nr:hypothetical protein [Calothrix sp. 336/3]AKG20591.1 hypothetical protein IJ00_04000 [Calothrix sp. 336/3]